jgi:hypothetical protein
VGARLAFTRTHRRSVIEKVEKNLTDGSELGNVTQTDRPQALYRVQALATNG